MKMPRFTLPAGPLASGTGRPMSRAKSDTLLLLATCTLVLLPHLGHLPAWAIPLCAALLAWRGWVTFRGNRMPPRWLLVSIAALAMGGVFATYKTFFGREAGVTMLTLLLALKLLEMHAKRDLFVALFLSFFLILASFFYSQSIGTALITVVAVIAILTTQLSFQYTGIVPPLRKRLRLGAMIVALAAPLMLVLFVLFPRIQGPLWGLPGDAQSGHTGLSDTMAPGNISSLAQSDEIAFRVKFTDPVPPKSALYWRGVVLGNYDGRTWSQLRTRIDARRAITVKLRGAPVRYQVTLEPHDKRWLFALEMPQAVPIVQGAAATVSANLQLLAARPINERVRYDVVSHIDYDLQPNEPASVLQQWLQLPPGFNPRTMEFAANLRHQHASNADAIAAVLHFFHEQNFRYTLEPPPLEGDVVDEFLFSTRAGFCEHYAGAFVVLMRAMDIPSRVVTGYQGGEMNPTDGFMTIRQSDAHAWAEVWLEGRGWTRVDPTAAVAPSRVERNIASVIPRPYFGGLITLDAGRNTVLAGLHRLRQNWEAVTNAWNQRVLNYTPEKQKELVQSLGFDHVDWRTLTALMFLLGSAVTAVMVLPLIVNRPRIAPADAAYHALCRSLERQGMPRALHEGPRAYRARLTAADSRLSSEKKAAAARFLEIYETLRYGDSDKSSATAVAQLKSLLTDIR
jgi:transglutaminase-like putative cysteine protease